jgi:gliding motility-associated-like protein
LTVRTNPFCIYEAEQNLIVHPIPEAGFFLDPEDADIFNSTIIGRDLSNGADSIAYLISDGALYVSRDFEHEFKDSGVYYVRQHAISTFGCMDSATRELYITFLYKLFIPNAFSPNADGYNDVFRPIGMGLKNYEMQIYNRWGQMVFSTDSGEAWDGAEAIHGYYAYVIKAYDFQGEPHFYKGVVYLVL